jgi:hypothetical protein
MCCSIRSLVFIVIPLTAGCCCGHWFIRGARPQWFEQELLPRFAPVSMMALLATLVLIFGFQADNITGKFLHVVLIAVPILIQVYFNSSLAYGLMRLFKVEYAVAAPGALIGASNFFELAVATAIALFGPESGAALATVVGVLIEVPVMLSVCAVCVRTKHWLLLARLDARLHAHAASGASQPLRIIIVGGGAGGVEVALCLPNRVHGVLGAGTTCAVTIITGDDRLVPGSLDRHRAPGGGHRGAPRHRRRHRPARHADRRGPAYAGRWLER